MVLTCLMSYAAKLFYFDVVDDSAGFSAQSGKGRHGMQHALSFYGDDQERWRLTLWIALSACCCPL